MKLRYILGLILTIGLSILYYRYNPGVYHFFPECPFHKYLQLDCPGCGSQRAVHALLHGNVRSALDYNAFLVISLPFLLIHLFLKTASYLTGKDYVWKIWYQPTVPKVIFIFVMVFWVARNIPLSPFIYLAS